MKKILLCALLVCASLSAEIRVLVPRYTIRKNESLQVTFKSDQKIKAQPDFKPLQADFEILSQNQNSSTRIINGQIDHDYSWTVVLMSKKEGTVTIPPIRFGAYLSEPVTIQVTEAKAAVKGDPIYFEVELSPGPQVFEQSQVVYTVRFYRAVNLYNGRISDISVSDPDTIIEPLGEDKEYDQMAGGVRYLVLERKYAVFPQHAGELTFAPIVFEGQIVTGGRSIFNMQTQHTVMSSDALKINVKPIPPPFTRQNWLAAEEVKLVDEWSGDISQVKAGEPITRTVTIMAVGCLASQIPAPQIPVPSQLKQYPDKPQAHNQTEGTGNTGVKQFKIALIASEPGTIELPEIQVNWWDVKANRMRTSTLPELKLQVTGEAAEVIAPPAALDAPAVAKSHSVPIWAWLLIGLNGIWMTAMLLMWLKGRRSKREPLEKDASLAQIKQALKVACTAHDAKAAENALLAWAKLTFPHLKPLNLGSLTAEVNEDLAEEIDDLNESLYSPHHLWNGKELWEAFQANKTSKGKSAKETSLVLKDLYN